MNNADDERDLNHLNTDNSRSFNYSSSTLQTFKFQRVKPKFYKLFNEIVSSHLEPVLDYLDLLDLCKIRAVNRSFLALIHNYYQRRLKFEINLITTYQEENKEKTNIFMKNIDSQIPISNKNWLDFDLGSVTQKLQLLDRNILTKLRSIKSIGKLSDSIYAPFCIIFGYNKNASNQTKNDTWKKTANKIFSDSNLILRISNLDLENMNDSEMLNAFVFLNLPELDIDTVKKYSTDFAKFLTWCQAVVSYHILIHPYTYRNDKSMITFGSDVYDFANRMNYMINRFYKFKRFLYNLGVVKIPLADYVFNLQHNRELPQKTESYFNNLPYENVGNILSFLPLVDSYKLMGISKNFFMGFQWGIDLIILEIFKEIYFFKFQAYDKIVKRIPVIYTHNIFSNYFLMLDDILNSSCTEQGMSFIPFLTKEQLNDLKKIKLKTEMANTIAKVFCVITDERPEKKQNARGDVEYLYLDKIRLLVISGKMLKLLRNVNKLTLSEQKLKIINTELNPYLSTTKLEEVKKVNHGLFQLLVWELFVLEFVKNYNPFEFINQDYINNRFEQDEVDMVNYYMEILNYMKYNLKLRYHFTAFGGNVPSFGFAKLNQDLRKYLALQNLETNNEVIFNSLNQEHTKIANVYFESKELIPVGAKPALFEKILFEIISCKEKAESGDVNASMNISLANNYVPNQLDVIQEEMKGSFSPTENDRLTSNASRIPFTSKTSVAKIRAIQNNPIPLSTDYLFNAASTGSPLTSLPSEVIIKHILFYLDINSLPKFALICHKTNDCVKTHIFIRLFFLNKEKRIIEQDNSEIINTIESKRQEFFEEYEIPPPKKEHAYSLMNQITSDDIMEIKQCFKKYNKNYENLITPLMILLGEKPKALIRPDGKKVVSYYNTAKVVLFKTGFVKRIRDMELETIPAERFKAVEKALENPNLNQEKIKGFSPSLLHLIYWITGVIEFHRVIRKYSLSSYDYEILNENEIEFCKEMDTIVLLYYKLLRYATKHCKQYESSAQMIMSTMNIQAEN